MRKRLTDRDWKLRKRVWLRTRAKMQNGVCALCGEPMGDDISFDHVHPQSKGGRNTFANCQATHRACNSFKSASIGYLRNDRPKHRKRD